VEVKSCTFVNEYMHKGYKVIEVHDGFADVNWFLTFGRKYVYLVRYELLTDGSEEIKVVGKWER